MTTQTASVLPGTWVVEPARSTSFVARGLGVARGTIPVTAGRIDVDASGLPTAVDAVLDVAAIDTANPRRDRDLRSKRFLDTATFPVMRFEAGSCVATGTGWTVTGTLRAAGHDAPLTLDVRLCEGGSPTERTVHAHGTLDRRDLGITVPSFMIRRHVAVEIRATVTCR